MKLRTILLLSTCLLTVGCSKVNQANYAQLKAGMTRPEVETLLGAPTECSGAIGLTSCQWGNETTSISIQFAGDKVMVFSGSGLK